VVPLWLGVNLRQRGKCRLVPPEWMDPEVLAQKKEEEVQSKVFTKMPSQYYMVMAQLLLGTAPQDVPNANLTRTLIKDIWDLRISKLRSSVTEFVRQDLQFAELHHLTPLELHTIQPLLPAALDTLARVASGGVNAAANRSHNSSLRSANTSLMNRTGNTSSVSGAGFRSSNTSFNDSSL